MEKIAWMTTTDGFQKVVIESETPRIRTVRLIGGARDGQSLRLPPVGMPNGKFLPALYEGEQPPTVWRYKGRSLPLVNADAFADPLQAKLLVPQKETYTFLPHTTNVIDAILASDHVLLFGGTGVGKTSLVLQIAARIGQPVLRVNFNGQVSVSDLVGCVGLTKEGTVWNDGALTRAMRNGYWLVLDEIDFGSPDILSILYPVLEGSPKLCLKEHDGEVIHAHPGFRVFATGNSIGGEDSQYCGTQRLNAALLNRFTGHGQAIKIEAMQPKQEREVLLSRLPILSKTLAKRACEFASRLRAGDAQNPALLPTFSTRELINYLAKMLLYRDPMKAAEATFLAVVQDKNIRQPLEATIGLIFGKRVGVSRQNGGGRAASGSDGRTAVAKASRKPVGKPTKTPAGDGETVGRVASEVTDPAEVAAIKNAYKGNGGTLSYKQIEDDPRFNLRKANGNTAYRIVKRTM